MYSFCVLFVLAANVYSDFVEENINTSELSRLQLTNIKSYEFEDSIQSEAFSSSKNISSAVDNFQGNLSEQRKNGSLRASKRSKSNARGNRIISDVNIPSLISDMLRKHSHNDWCRQTSHRNLLVRSFSNQGKVIYSGGAITILSLDYTIDSDLMKDKNLTYAGIYSSPNHLRGHQWKNRFSGSIFHYSMYRHHKQKPNVVEERLDILLHQLNAFVPSHEEHAKVMSKLEELFGLPIAVRTVSHDYTVRWQNEDTLDLTAVARKWRQAFISHKHVNTQMVLAITEFKDSSLFQTLASSSPRCEQPSEATLVLVLFQCPVDNLDEQTSPPLLRQKRAFQASLKRKLSQSSHFHKANLESSIQTHIHFHKANLESSIQTHLAKSRSERSTRRTICQRESMWVSFEDLGWSEWIIAPRAFQAYRCVGECPYPLGGRINSTNYAMLASMMNSVDPKNSPMPCCVPTSLGEISVLYLDNSNNVVLRNYDGMVVEGCGCR